MDDKYTSSQEKNTNQTTTCGSNLSSAFLLDLRGKQNTETYLDLQPCITDTLAPVIKLIINAAKQTLLGRSQAQTIDIL